MSNESPMYPELGRIIQDWMYDKTAQVGPERIMVGNNFDILKASITQLITREADRAVQEFAEAVFQHAEDMAFSRYIPLNALDQELSKRRSK